MTNLYTQTVLDHARAPRHYGTLDSHTHAADGANPLCGDRLRIEVQAQDACVVALRFRGDACAIATASASMLGELAQGKSAQQLAQLESTFTQLIEGRIESDAALADLNSMRELAQHPARRTCALLPFATLRAALAGAAAATSEGSPP